MMLIEGQDHSFPGQELLGCIKWKKQAKHQHASIHCSLLTVGSTWPAPPCSHCLAFPTMMDCTLNCKLNSSSFKLLLSVYFTILHQNKQKQLLRRAQRNLKRHESHPDDTQTCIRPCLKQFSLQHESSVTEGHNICLAGLCSTWFYPKTTKTNKTFIALTTITESLIPFLSGSGKQRCVFPKSLFQTSQLGLKVRSSLVPVEARPQNPITGLCLCPGHLNILP